jgi:hypothetical protein
VKESTGANCHFLCEWARFVSIATNWQFQLESKLAPANLLIIHKRKERAKNLPLSLSVCVVVALLLSDNILIAAPFLFSLSLSLAAAVVPSRRSSLPAQKMCSLGRQRRANSPAERERERRIINERVAKKIRSFLSGNLARAGVDGAIKPQRLQQQHF